MHGKDRHPQHQAARKEHHWQDARDQTRDADRIEGARKPPVTEPPFAGLITCCQNPYPPPPATPLPVIGWVRPRLGPPVGGCFLTARDLAQSFFGQTCDPGDLRHLHQCASSTNDVGEVIEHGLDLLVGLTLPNLGEGDVAKSRKLVQKVAKIIGRSATCQKIERPAGAHHRRVAPLMIARRRRADVWFFTRPAQIHPGSCGRAGIPAP